MTQWMQFITLRPAVVMIMENGKVELIRKPEDLAYVMSPESVPSSLTLPTLS
jgi:diaminopimelate decarboxylase